MNLSQDNYLYAIKQIITGQNTSSGAADGGFLVDEDISKNLQVISTAVTLGTGALSTTVISASTVITNPVIPSTGSIQFGPFHIGRDYDQASDTCQFRFTGSVAAGAVTEPIAAWLNVYAPGAVPSSSTATAVQTATCTLVSTTYNAFAVSVSGNSLAQDDIIYLNLSTSTAPITVLGGALVYASCQVAWDLFGSELVGTSSQEIRG